MRRLGIDLHSAASEIEKARTIVKLDAIPKDYHLEVIDQFEQQRTANAWLYPGNDPYESHPVPADELFSVVRNILGRTGEPLTDLQIAANLGVTKTQARKWLERLVQEDGWEKLERPVRYKLR